MSDTTQATVPTVEPLRTLMNGEIEDLPIVTSFEEVHEVFTSRKFVMGGWSMHPTSLRFLKGTIVMLEGEEHAERLRVVKPLFTRESLIRYEQEVLVPSINRSLGELTADDDGWVRANLVALGRNVLTRIAATIIGLDGVTTPERTARLVYFSERIAVATGIKFAKGDLEELTRALIVDRDEFISEFVAPARASRLEKVEAWRRGDLPESELPDDLITRLIAGTKADWDEDLINREVTVFLVAATLTTAMSVPHAVYHIEHWVDQHPEDAERRRDREFLRHAAYESIRLHASSPTQFRRAVDATTISSGKSFDANQEVAVCGALANRDPTVYGENANVYDAGRRPPGNGRRLYGHAFAAGRHRCLGEHLAVGMPSRGDTDNGTLGMVLSLLSALYARDIEHDPDRELDPDREPQKNPIVENDFYSELPIRMRAA